MISVWDLVSVSLFKILCPTGIRNIYLFPNKKSVIFYRLRSAGESLIMASNYFRFCIVLYSVTLLR